MAETIQLRDLPKGRITESIAGQAGRCMYQIFLQHVKGYPSRGNSGMSLGNGIHAGLQWADTEQIEGRPRPAIELIQDYYGKLLPNGDPKQPLSMIEGALRVEIAKTEKYTHLPIEWEDGDTPASLIEEGRRMIATHETEIGCHLSPVAAEWSFELTLPEEKWKVKGRLDLVDERDGKFCLIDRKTGGKLKTIFDLLCSGQFTTYQRAWLNEGGQVHELAIHSIQRPTKENPNGRAKIIGPLPPRTEQEMADRLEALSQFVGMIRAGYFPKCDNWMVCSGFCSFLEECKPNWYAFKKKFDAEKAIEDEAKRVEKERVKAEKEEAKTAGKATAKTKK